MNLKERGVTVGDLLIILIIIITTTILIKSLNKDRKTTLDPFNQQKVFIENPYFKSQIKNFI
tara:strand:- start:278 stop:463 length:186 start_codon:yes stop_codon:yes gene_type:complete